MQCTDPARLVQLVEQGVQRGNVVVALYHGRHRAAVLQGVAIELPDGLANWVVMRVNQVAILGLMTGQVDLAHACWRNRIDVVPRVEAVVDAAHIDVVDVQQQFAVRALQQFADKLPLGHLVG